MKTAIRWQYTPFAVLSLGAAAAVLILFPDHRAFFHPYFGAIHPLLAIVLVIALGVVACYLLFARGWFSILNASTFARGVRLSAVFATLLAAVMITADSTIFRFPVDINVPLPQALLFYPAMAYVVEVIFHALPLGIFLTILGLWRRQLTTHRLIWLCLCVTALLEPTFQVGYLEQPLSPMGIYLWLDLFVFNVLQLYILQRYDFVSMFSLRIIYYLYWHIAWGYLRLQLLF